MSQTVKPRKVEEGAFKGSADGWLDAAYEVLKESGIDAVRVMPLAKQLKVSRTSFYWFFEDREQLLDALLARWRDLNTGNMLRQCESYAESLTEAILNVVECWLTPGMFDAQFEFAVRSWALQSDEVAKEIVQADKTRIEGLAVVFRRFGYDEAAADARARAFYLAQIGYITMKMEESLIERLLRVPHYIGIFTGKAPKRRELDRFYGKFGYAEKEPGVFVALSETF